MAYPASTELLSKALSTSNDSVTITAASGKPLRGEGRLLLRR